MLIKKPVITEKTLDQYKKDRKVTFEVDLNANKLIVKKMIESVYGVEVDSVRVINRVGKYRRKRITRYFGKTKDQKFAILKLKEGNKIDIFEGNTK